MRSFFVLLFAFFVFFSCKTDHPGSQSGRKKLVKFTLPAEGLSEEEGGFWSGTNPICRGAQGDCEKRFMLTDKSEDCQMSGKRFYCTYPSFEYTREKGKEDPDRRIKIATYNIFIRRTIAGLDGQRERADQIPFNVSQFDNHGLEVVVHQEAFDYYDEIKKGYKAYGFPYASKKLKSAIPGLEHSGVLVVSKHEIVKEDSEVYTDATHSDWFAGKGVIYVKIMKGEQPYHIFATHTQAWDDAHQIRGLQLAQLKAFKNRQDIPTEEPVLYIGDFNIDRVAPNNPEFNELMGKLKVQDMSLAKTASTYDPKKSVFVGADGEAKAKGCADTYLTEGYCTQCLEATYDYILQSNEHKKARKVTEKIVALKTKSPFTVHMKTAKQNAGTQEMDWDVRDLSDHAMVWGEYIY